MPRWSWAICGILWTRDSGDTIPNYRLFHSGLSFLPSHPISRELSIASLEFKRYEFGVKASIATTNKSNFVVGGMAVPGSPYDGHTLKKALAQVRRLTGSAMDEAFVDKGYRGHDETDATVFISGQKRGIKTQRLKRSLKRRQAIEPVIGHLKADGLLGRNYLKGTQGDQFNVLLSCAGHNLRLILRKFRLFCLRRTTQLAAWLRLWVNSDCLSWLPTPSMAA